MATKIQANAFVREYHPLIDLDGNTSSGMRTLYHENRILKNGENPCSFASCDREKVRQTILKHESIFRNQLQELHRLYGRQRELMNEIKRRELKKDNAKEEKCRSGYLFSPLFSPTQNERSLRSSSVFPSESISSEKRNHQQLYVRDDKFSLTAVQTSQHKADALTFDLYFKRNDNAGDISIANPTDGISDRLTLSRGEMPANSCSNFNLVTKDFFQNSLDRTKGEDSPSILGLRNERSGKEQLSDAYAERRRFDKHSSFGDFCSGKSLAFPQSLLAEPRKDFSNGPLDMGASVSRKRKKIFGVEISEENDDTFNAASNKSSNLDQKAGKHDENHRVFSLESSSWIANSFVKNLELRGANLNDGDNERSKADLKGETSSQKGLSTHSDTKGKWLEGCPSIGLNFVEHRENDHPKKYFKNAAEDSKENSQKFQQMIPQHQLVPADCQNNTENPKGGLPWFLRNAQVSSHMSKEKKSSYFMNLDSLQNCSQKFFGKAEMPDATFQTPKQKKEISASMSAQDAEDEINEVNDDTSAKKFLGFPISDVLQSFKDLNSGENSSKVETQKGLNNYISDLRHCIDLNLSLDDEDAPSAPSLPTAVVKIATTEIDLEAPAVIESEMDASPKEVESEKVDTLQGKSKLHNDERHKIAAEAMIAISLSTVVESTSIDSLKWFAEIVSSQCVDCASILVEVPMNQSRASDEEESVPNGMDYFEFMTLKLEDTKEKSYNHEAFALNNPSDDEAGATPMRRARRGQSRRGRQRKDFQRDILPGLITLSRVEVTEDFQAFEELLRAEGGTRQAGLSHRSSTRNARGRKRLGGANTSPKLKTLCSTQAQQPVCQLEERSLTGWGKRTRRLPRQRCPNAFLSFPVKC